MKGKTISTSVQESVDGYLNAMDDQQVTDLYEMVLAEVEVPLIKSVLGFTRNNQSRTAEILGLNRGTLRKKLRKYQLL
jgi:Fis family transcriptional regulator